MTIVAGKIEPLKRLKETLHSHGIYRFNSIGDINAFLKQYESEKNNIPENVKLSTDDEIKGLEAASRNAIEVRDKNIFNKFIYYFKARKLIKKHAILANNYEAVLSQRSSDAYRELEFIKETVEGLYSTIAGAVGENAVVSELQKLSDKYYLINDFSLKFNPPIFNKRENDRIYSIQIDHLLICQSGIFVLETKNWSTKSIENLDLRSPVEQIKRASFALFVFLNSDKNQGLVRDHWGSKKIPIKNIVVMTNKAPKSDFQHVKVVPLDKLNGYIQYFDEIFDESETENIFNYLNDETQ
ncbi:MAG: nuclease-related domain-containing protein [Thermodesulfobacteriota bacterium]